MKLHKTPACSRGATSVSLALFVVAVAACGGAEDSSPSVPHTGVGAGLQLLSTSPSSSDTCARDLTGAVTVTPDHCPGGGAPRVLARLSGQATCSSVGAALAASLPATRAGYQFDDAPPSIKAQFCVFQGGAGAASMVAPLLASLCSYDSILLATHDCSTDPSAISPTDPNSYVAPEGQVSTGGGPRSPSLDADPNVKHNCDTCASVAKNTLFVNIPDSMTANGNALMVVRFPGSSQPDVTIRPPVGAESFTVPNIGVADTTAVLIYAPGEVPPPK